MKFLKSKAGFTLVEVMVAAGIIGGLSLAVMQMMSNLNKTSKRASQVFTIEQEVRKISQILQDKDACRLTLTDARGALSPTFPGNPVAPELNVFNSAHDPLEYSEIKTPSGIKYQTYDVDGGGNPAREGLLDNEYGSPRSQVISLTGIALQGWSEESQFTNGAGDLRRIGNATVRLRFKKGRVATNDDIIKKTSFGATELTKTVAVKVIVDDTSSEVVECYSSADQYITSACTSLGGEVDGDGRCVEYMARNDSNPANRNNPALTVGDGDSPGNLGVGNYLPPLVVSRNDMDWYPAPGNPYPVQQKLEFDDDEIQSIAAAGSVLHLNRRGGNVSMFNDLAADLLINGDINLSGTGDIVMAGELDVNGVGQSNIAGSLFVNLGTELNNTLDVTGAATLDSTLDVDGVTNINNNLIVDGNTTLGDAAGTDTTTLNSALTANGTATFQAASTFNNRLTRPGFFTAGTNATAYTGDDEVPTIGWVRYRIARAIAPDTATANDIAAAIIGTANSNVALREAIKENDCTSQTWDTMVTKTYNAASDRCEYTVDTSIFDNCSTSGTCSQICIGTSCATSWSQVGRRVFGGADTGYGASTTTSTNTGGCYILSPGDYSYWKLGAPLGDAIDRADACPTCSYSSAVTTSTRTCARDYFIKGFSRITAGRIQNSFMPVCCRAY